ncbi:hypothetical protein LCGC14_0803810 [marine sediment metagenome]|uniref:DUF559 domain-containing protein n=1 Tax=marine sediment metagenome TaxID=412755 RepID=A0A0F9PTH9_9ZZZZ
MRYCYNCLLRFRNQYDHKYLNRKLVIPLVKQLKSGDISKISIDQGIAPIDKIKTLKDKCDSELEKKVLDEIVLQKLPIPDEAQKTYYEGDIPITKADFFYSPGTFVFVDGPPHTSDQVQIEDREKRNKLESVNFTVIELDFKDGAYNENHSLIEKEVLKMKEYLD